MSLYDQEIDIKIIVRESFRKYLAQIYELREQQKKSDLHVLFDRRVVLQSLSRMGDLKFPLGKILETKIVEKLLATA